MTTLDERYDDLLAGRDDSHMTRLVADLDHACAARTAPQAGRLDAALDDALRRRATRPRPVSATRRRVVPWRRRPLLLAAVAALGLVTVATVASVSAGSLLIDRLFGLFANETQQAAWMNRGVDLHLAQTACGQTMTLQHAYADANRIVVGYTLSGGGSSVDAHLADAHGTTFPPLDAGALAPEAGTTGNVATFDASGIAGLPAQLTLRLTAPGPVTSGGTPCPQAYDFAFAAPFVEGQSLAPTQTVVSQGVAVTLDRVVVTPIETRVYVRTTGKPVNSPYLADFTVAGHDLESGFNGYTSPMGPVVTDIFSFRSIADERGTATLTLSWPQGAESALPRGQAHSSPWIFHIALP